MARAVHFPAADDEELQDLTALESQDGVGTTTFAPLPGLKSSSPTRNKTSAYHYRDVRSSSRSPSPHGPIQVRQNSYRLQMMVSSARKRLSGWEMGMILAVSADLAVLVIVLALTLVAALRFPRDGLRATLIDDDCDPVRKWSTWLHLGINIVSTILLATSSYAMQCLTSPTREEINRTHLRGRCMDIGVPSFGNLLKTSRHRMLLWLVIVLSSLPLHLLANSAVYETQGANSYVMAVVEEDFISRPLSGLSQGYAYTGAGFNSPEYVIPRPSWVDKIEVTLYENTTRLLKELVPKMERLENADCMKAYSQPLLSNRRSVIAVTSRKLKISPKSTYNYIDQLYYQSVDVCPDCQSYRYYTDPTLWLCAWLHGNKQGSTRGCDVSAAINRASEWEISYGPIEYCLSERAVGQCQLQANISIMISVIVCALVKIIAIIAAFCTMPKDIIATIGDAVASFLRDREPQTSGCCLMSRGTVHNHFIGRWKSEKRSPKPWAAWSLKKRWGSAPSVTQWFATILFLGALLITTIAFFSIGRQRLKHAPVMAENSYGLSAPSDIGSIMRMGFGVVNVNFLVTLPDMSSRDGVIGHTLLVNTPQLVLSFSYFAYNAIWTQMLIAREWAQFGIRRLSLRVSLPSGQQRSNYFLTIPYMYAIPLLTISAILHWLLSQSFFLARINVNSAPPFVNTPPAVINTVGYSLGALLMFFIVASVTVLVVMLFGIFMKLSSPIPVVAGCSLAISAACHPLNESDEMRLVPLKWGIVGESMSTDDKDGGEIKHCSFSAGEVSSPADLPLTTQDDNGKTLVLFA